MNKQDRWLQKSHGSGRDLDLQDAWWLRAGSECDGSNEKFYGSGDGVESDASKLVAIVRGYFMPACMPPKIDSVWESQRNHHASMQLAQLGEDCNSQAA